MPWLLRPEFLRNVMHRQPYAPGKWLVYSLLLVVCGLLSACNNTGAPANGPTSEIVALEELPPGTCGLTLAPNLSAEEQIWALIEAEGQLMAAREIGPLMALWAEESRVINARNTPNDPDDYQIWQGKDAIRHRYLNVVFPSAPQVVNPPDLDITVADDQAWARGSTQIGTEISHDGDRWETRRIGECWQIVELTYNLEPLESTP